MGRKTTSEFINEAIKVHKGFYLYDKVVYSNNKAKVTITCPIHGDFEQIAYNHLKGQGCSKCAYTNMSARFRKDTETFINEAKAIWGTLYNYSKTEYKGSHEKVIITCPIHGDFMQTPRSHLNKHGCPNCFGGVSKNTADFVQKSSYNHKNKYNYDKTIYINNRSKVTVTCPIHGDFKQAPDKHLIGQGCPKCSTMYSKEEKALVDYIKSIYKGTIIENDRELIKPYEIDIYLPELNLGFEYNGNFFHSEKYGKNKNYHLDKTNLAKEKGVRLVHIFSDDWENRNEIVKSRIENFLGLTLNKIYARKCTVQPICTASEYIKFLDQNHIQGRTTSTLKLGLYHDGELVSVMGFGLDRHNYFVLNRFASKLHTVVNGGFSKLFKYFLENYPQYTEIKSLADVIHSEGNLYERNGFTLSHTTKPDYTYIVKGERVHKQNFMKKNLVKQGFDPNKTERQIMEERGIPRIYDCGKLVYIYKRL